jgi:hypothetical protein
MRGSKGELAKSISRFTERRLVMDVREQSKVRMNRDAKVKSNMKEDMNGYTYATVKLNADVNARVFDSAFD